MKNILKFFFSVGLLIGLTGEAVAKPWTWDWSPIDNNYMACLASGTDFSGRHAGREYYVCSAVPAANNELYMPIRKTNSTGAHNYMDVVGCYDWNFKKVYTITGDPRSAKCMKPEAPIRFFLTYAITCPDTPETATKCTWGSEILVYPKMILDGPNPYGEAFQPFVRDDLPIRITNGQVGTNASEICDLMNKDPANPLGGGTPKYVYDSVLQSCKKLPKTYCEEMGFYWSADDEMCISEKNPICDAAKCSDEGNYCIGHTYRPSSEKCICVGKAPVTTVDSSVRGACSWVHTEDLANPYCDPSMDASLYKWVPNPSDPYAEVCCEDGDTACGARAPLSPGAARAMYTENPGNRAPAGLPVP
ncbi:MAG: hypothetical protein EOP09_14965 [Proteobacteria bacterium]|nr:MAG: hypothetical protein EOP09_14965 [Pseudomonadota bacterium]